MSPGLALIAHSYRRVRVLVLGAALLLAAFQVLLCLAAKAGQELNAFGKLSALIPEFLRQLMGPSLISLMSFSGIVCLGYFHVAVVSTAVGIGMTVATEISAEIETRFVDLILSRPLARHWLVTRSVVILIAASVVLLLAMVLGSSVGLYLLAPVGLFGPTLRLIRSLALNLGALIACWGGVALAVASFARRRSVAGAIAGLLALATYLFDYIAQVWKPAAGIAPLFPFHYYNPLRLIAAGGIPWSDVRVLLGFAAAGAALAYVQFMHRDL